VTSRRLTDRSTLLRALGLGALTLALLTPAAAQERFSRPSLRGADQRQGAQTQDDPAGAVSRDALAMRGSVEPGEPLVARGAQRPTRRAQARRTRPPTAAPVRAPTRLPTISPNVEREVQPVVIGLPDSTPPPAPRRKPPPEADPYAPLGLRLGGLSVFPVFEQDAGYDTNPNRASNIAKKGSWVSRTGGELRLRSDWLVHELVGELRGGYSVYPDVREADRPDGEGRLALRLDATRDTAINLEARYRIDTERPGSPDINAPVVERPIAATAGASAGVTQRFNRLSLGLRGVIDRTVYEDARLASGAILDQSDRNTTQYGVRLRAGYELTPGLMPFVEGLADTRRHDDPVDSAGFRRDSDGLGVRAGTTFEITRLLTGEASAGLQARHYDDPRLRDLRGPLIDAALIWAATPLTTVRLRAQSEVEETTIPFSSGALTQRATLEVQHDFRRNLTLTAAASLAESDYRGVRLKEDTFTGSLKLDYRLTRSLALRASFTHERLKSTTPGADYTANVFLLGLRLQP
jgi:hypothetical protein